jgi:hypothetical protein
MRVEQLMEILSTLREDAEVYIANGDDVAQRMVLEPVTVSCDDPTVMGYIIVPESMVKH